MYALAAFYMLELGKCVIGPNKMLILKCNLREDLSQKILVIIKQRLSNQFQFSPD